MTKKVTGHHTLKNGNNVLVDAVAFYTLYTDI